uniref:Reverse transcriptase zinc-binding domain-containing protein n=1 Tax=Nicotiana tabacum TaxID=4097 RepID=A0A1S4DEG0_TOBAC|nr:PREDICTED: uncharacterized protein LOC107828951 [Nicotiana tabacum]
MWLQCQDKLLTVDRLLSWGLNVQAMCALCQSHNETRNYLFAERRYAQAIWNRVSKWAQQQLYGGSNWELQFHEIIKSIQGKTTKAKLIKMIYAEVIYTVWKERNSRVFEGVDRDCEGVAKEIACVCSCRATGALKYLMQKLVF